MTKKSNNNNVELEYISLHIAHPYGNRILVATPTSEKENLEIEEIFKIEDSKINLCGVYKINYEGWNSYLAVFNFDHLQSITYGMIAHEANHIVDFIIDSIGQVVDPQNNEYSAYLLEWLTNKFFQHLIDRDLMKLLATESIILKKDEQEEGV